MQLNGEIETTVSGRKIITTASDQLCVLQYSGGLGYNTSGQPILKYSVARIDWLIGQLVNLQYSDELRLPPLASWLTSSTRMN